MGLIQVKSSHGVELGGVESTVNSSRVERIRVEWRRVKSIQLKSSHGVELSEVESTVDSS